MKKPLDPVKQFRDWMKNTLRRAFFRYWERTKALQAARVDRGVYKCAVCGGLSSVKGMHIDHILPVVDPQVGFVGWDTYISRLFCAASNLQLLCKPCHTVKTEKERLERKAAKTGIYAVTHAGTMSAACKGILKPALFHAVIGTHDTSGPQEFNSVKEASEATGVARKRVSDILGGRRDKSKGWVFKYQEKL